MGRLLDEDDVYALFAPNGTARLHVADIDALPRVDAKEVVHGWWMPIFDKDDLDGTLEMIGYKCSVCEEQVGWLHGDSYKYCPNCGAKMDLED